MNEWLVKPEIRVRATEDARTDVSVISLVKNSISYYITHLRGQIICNISILREKTVRLRKEKPRSQGFFARKTSHCCAEHSKSKVQVSWKKPSFLARPSTWLLTVIPGEEDRASEWWWHHCNNALISPGELYGCRSSGSVCPTPTNRTFYSFKVTPSFSRFCSTELGPMCVSSLS